MSCLWVSKWFISESHLDVKVYILNFSDLLCIIIKLHRFTRIKIIHWHYTCVYLWAMMCSVGIWKCTLPSSLAWVLKHVLCCRLWIKKNLISQNFNLTNLRIIYQIIMWNDGSFCLGSKHPKKALSTDNSWFGIFGIAGLSCVLRWETESQAGNKELYYSYSN